MSTLRFRPTLVPTLATVVLLVLLCTLGMWQLGRADYKEGLFADYAERSVRPPLDLNYVTELTDRDRYARAEAVGRFDAMRQLLLDNRTYNGVAGYDVLTPFQISGTSQVLLVNRGWVAGGPRREILPETPVDEGELRLQGLLDTPPRGGIVLGEQGYETSGWPLVVQRIEVRGVAQKLGTPVLPLVLRMDPELPNGFVRAWKPYYGLSAERHRGYAFQWFALATALLVIYVVLNTKRRPTPEV